MDSWAGGQDAVLTATTHRYPAMPELMPERLVVEAEIVSRPDSLRITRPDADG
ncbi:hypothetical protein [Actinomyces qiguomingii]|uniref:hypothetical protein n=1 Tax=Actinomyces qiguomingii TaxID=2057800 RepID=UPI001304EAA0|nr:hypothetical protein [Actinomyces qiguomingii]